VDDVPETALSRLRARYPDLAEPLVEEWKRVASSAEPLSLNEDLDRGEFFRQSKRMGWFKPAYPLVVNDWPKGVSLLRVSRVAVYENFALVARSSSLVSPQSRQHVQLLYWRFVDFETNADAYQGEGAWALVHPLNTKCFIP